MSILLIPPLCVAAGLLGNDLPGSWRPFADDSPWNTPIPVDAPSRADSSPVRATMTGHGDHIRFSRRSGVPVWVVNSPAMPLTVVRGDRILPTRDVDGDDPSDVGVPLDRAMAASPGDGDLCVVDPARNIAWEMSGFDWPTGAAPTCATVSVWDLAGSGCGRPGKGGGRGSGFPLVAGLLRPEEVEAGVIRHALVFTFASIRRASDGAEPFIVPPACRSDGESTGVRSPVEGTRLQLDPALTDSDFDVWGLGEKARVVARALQRYGMYLGDRGGDWEIQVQLLSDDPAEHRDLWEERLPGFYSSIERIPTSAFRIVEVGGKIVSG